MSTSSSRGILASVAWMLRKEVRLEWRSPVRVQATLFYALLTLILFSVSTALLPPREKILAAPGTLWLALVVSSALSLSQSMLHEIEHRAIDGLRLMPVSPAAVFLGKAIFNAAFIWLMALLLTPVTLAVFDAPLKMGLGWHALVCLLGAGGIAAPGTMYASFAVQLRAKDVVFPMLLFPVLLPVLMLCVSATEMVMTGDAMGNFGLLLTALAGCNLIMWPLGAVLFGQVLE